MLKIYSTIILVSSVALASDDMVIPQEHLMASSKGNRVTFDKKGFSVNGNPVQDYDLDKSLRYITTKQELQELFSRKHRGNYIPKKILVSRVGNDYALGTHDTLSGQGVLFGQFLGWTVRTVIYGIASVCVNKAAKNTLNISTVVLDKWGFPNESSEVIVTGLQTYTPALPATCNTRSTTIAAAAIDATQHRYPEAHEALVDGATVLTAAHVASTGGFPAVEALAKMAEAFGTSIASLP